MSVFNFKHFSVQQTNSAMKVGTDAMLLGSLASNNDPVSILDIGTGTGVVALMLSQRYPGANVKAVEIDELAGEEARSNFNNSPFKERLSLEVVDFLDFQTDERFDLIVSNPPFFKDSLLSPVEQRSKARHAYSLPPEQFLQNVSELLSDTGRVEVIIPSVLGMEWIEIAGAIGLFANRMIWVCGKEGEGPIRLVLSLSKNFSELEEINFTVRDLNSKYTVEYIELTKDFHDRVPK